MKKHSAGIIVYRKRAGMVEVLMAHMGAPWWAKKDVGAWSIPKGQIEEGEVPLAAAKREYMEEFSLPVPEGEFIDLGTIDQHNNKTVHAWAVEANLDASSIKSNTFETEWPPKSGRLQEFPEIDRAEWKSLEEASQKSVRGQAELFKRLADILGVELKPDEENRQPAQQSLL